jgi:hypothetical protein
VGGFEQHKLAYACEGNNMAIAENAVAFYFMLANISKFFMQKPY